MLFDPSQLVLFCFAITCIIYGSVKSHTFLSSNKSNTEVVETNTSLKLRTIVVMALVGCVFLLLLFFFYGIVRYFLFVLVVVVSGFSLFVVGAPIIDFVFARAGWAEAKLRVPIVRGGLPYSIIALIVLCLVVLITWIVTGNWFVSDCLAWCIGVTQLSVIRLPNLKLAVVMLSLFLLYDVFFVFISPYFFGGRSVMIEVATKLPTAMPLTLTMPYLLKDFAISMMGLGDVVIPGLFVCFTYNFDEALKYLVLYGAPSDLSEQAQAASIRTGKIGYFPIAVVGYTSGFFLTIIVLFMTQSGQPALLYLVPGVLLPVCAAAYLQGHLGLMWSGPPANIIPPNISNDEEQALVSMNDDESTLQQTSTIAVPTITADDVAGSAVLTSASKPNLNEEIEVEEELK